MKRLLAFLLATMMLLAISACGKEEVAPKKEENPETEIEVTVPEEEPYEEKLPPEAAPNPENIPESNPEPEPVPETEAKPEPEAKPEVKPDEAKPTPEVKPEAKPTPETKPTTETKPAVKPEPEVKPEVKPETKPETPAVKPEVKPEVNPSEPVVPPPAEENPEEKPVENPSGTVGDALAADFRANSGKSGTQIAETVIKNSVIPSELSLMTMEIEEGYLTGFDNTEIKGFENCVMFAPAMGTIPFVGYVFTLPAGADADAFVKTLKEGANLRWNICTSAEQMIVEKSGNKVFFVMCPKSFE